MTNNMVFADPENPHVRSHKPTENAMTFHRFWEMHLWEIESQQCNRTAYGAACWRLQLGSRGGPPKPGLLGAEGDFSLATGLVGRSLRLIPKQPRQKTPLPLKRSLPEENTYLTLSGPSGVGFLPPRL